MTSPMLDLRAALRHARDQFIPRQSKWADPGQMARALDPRTVTTPALRLIDDALADVAAGRTLRLMISMSPQEGKSEKVSRRFPTWMLHRRPDLRIAIVSYAYRIARRWGERIRDDIVEHGGKLDLEVKPDAAADEWHLTGKLGGVYCTGIGGPLTGRAVDCLRGDTLILTRRGYVPIRDLHGGNDRPDVLTVNHDTGSAEWRPIVATRAVPDRPLVEIVTAAGRRIVCTPDHRVYTARGYVPAAEVRPGEGLVTTGESAGDLQRNTLRSRLPETPVDALARDTRLAALLLPRMSGERGNSAAHLFRLRNLIRGFAVRGGKGAAQGVHQELLHQDLQLGDDVTGNGRATALRDVRQAQAGQEPQSTVVLAPVQAGRANRRRRLRRVFGSVHAAQIQVQRGDAGRRPDVLLAIVCRQVATHLRASLFAVREADRIEAPGPALLLERMPVGDEQSGQGTPLPAVWTRVPASQQPGGLLRPHLRRRGARATHDRIRQFPFQIRNQLCPMVPADAPADLRARRAQVRGLQGPGPTVPSGQSRRDVDADQLAGAPHQREAAGQPAAEPDHAVQDVPRGAPQVGRDTVAVVRQLRGERDTVYDLQVEGNHNFFADQVLVHNCLIIDDPYKDGKQADSVAWNDRVRGWWEEVAIPRLGPGVAVVIVATRWREDDLIGWLQTREDGDVWRVINIPAQADHDPANGETDPLGREPGEYMKSARGTTEAQWEAKKRAMGTRAWTALCQGRPAPASGDIFHDDWWQEYDAPQWAVRDDGAHLAIGFDQLIVSVDCAFKDTEDSDFVALQVWGRRGVDAYLLDQVCERLSFVDTVDRFRRLCAKWPQAILKLIEDKANGTAVINSLQRRIGGMVPVEPIGSKVERAFAVSPFVEGRNVYLPAPEMAPWVDAFKLEAKQFPRAANDDQVDALSQALYRLLLQPLLEDDEIVEDDEDGPVEGSISRY